MDVDECERIVAQYRLPVAVKCMKWDGEETTRTARGYFTAGALEGNNQASDTYDSRGSGPERRVDHPNVALRALQALGASSTSDERDDQSSTPEIVLLPERIYGGERELRELLAHELVHAYDHCVLRRDLTICEELACSEIRAAREAECSGYDTSLLKGGFCRNIAPQSEYCTNVKRGCVERIAIRSTKSVFGQEKAEQCVRAVFERCMSDMNVPRVEPK